MSSRTNLHANLTTYTLVGENKKMKPVLWLGSNNVEYAEITLGDIDMKAMRREVMSLRKTIDEQDGKIAFLLESLGPLLASETYKEATRVLSEDDETNNNK